MTIEGIVIEPLAGPEDLTAVAALEASSFTNPWTREMLERELHQSDVARVYVLRLPGAPVAAFCSCWVLFDELHINTIAVDGRYRRQGLATALMRYVLADVARQGVRRATLEVRRSNHAARELYARLGFTEVAVREAYYTSPREDALILWREGLAAAEPEGPTPADSRP